MPEDVTDINSQIFIPQIKSQDLQMSKIFYDCIQHTLKVPYLQMLNEIVI